MVFQHLHRLDLPHLNDQRWQMLKDLYSELDGIQTAKRLAEVLGRLFTEAGNDLEVHAGDCSTDVWNSNSTGSDWSFEGLGVFLEEIASEEENETFFNNILPFIVYLASSIDEFSPTEGIPLCSQQRESGVVLDRKFIACVLASAFLCTLPPPPHDSQVRSINFINFFACFHREEIQLTQAAKLRCVIHYFERLSNDWPNIEGRVFYSRQQSGIQERQLYPKCDLIRTLEFIPEPTVIPGSSLPTLQDWESCDLPLCPVIIDNKTSIEDSGECMLQVDFANRFIGGGVLGAGHVQEEIRFCINPELLVAKMFMEAMQDNECIVVRGVERFSTHSGYGKTFEFTGDFKDKSQRDENGDFLTTIVAIDAIQFKSISVEAQYEETALVRELNKALVGFYNPEAGSQIIHNTSGKESEQSSAETDGQEFSYQETESTLMEESQTSLPTDVKVQEFSDNLVHLALTQAFTEVDSNNNLTSEDVADGGDSLTPIMKKSLIQVFGSTPDKARKYSDNFLCPTPLPKCVTRTISGSNTPVIPGTPPSSPAVWDLEQKSLDSSGFQCFLSSPRSFPVKSFADSLSNSLMSCVELTSSLSAAIATAADSPVLAASSTKEAFQKIPKYLGSPVKNGDGLISFLSQKVYKSDTPLSKKHSNGLNISEFVEDLSSLVNSPKANRHRDSTDSYARCPNAMQNLLEEFDQARFEDRGKEELKKYEGACTSDAMLFEQFATKLSRSVLGSAISCSVGSKKDGSGANLEKEVANDPVASDVLTSGSSGVDASQRAAEKEKGDLRGLLEGHVEYVLEGIISVAVEEATRLCDEKSDDVASYSGNADENGDGGESDSFSQSEESGSYESEIQGLEESNTSSQESSEVKQDDMNEGVKTISNMSENDCNQFSLISEAAIQTAEKMAGKIVFDGLTQASEIIEGDNMDTNGHAQNDTQLAPEEGSAEESFYHDDLTADKTLPSFAENLSSLTVHGAVEIAKACFNIQSGSRVRPVATGNWGCGVFRGDPELKAIIQWAAASAAGCPVVVYHSFGDKRISELLKTLVCLQSRGWKISDVIQGVLRFCESTREESEGAIGHQKLLSFLCHTPQTSL